MGALAITGKESIRAPFAPFGFDVRWVEYGDAARAARTRSTTQVAAVFLEPTQGEGGVIPAPAGYLAAARQACDNAGALLVLDEIQSGIGRTGAWFAHQAEGVTPDVMTLAKGLGGGLPIGAYHRLRRVRRRARGRRPRLHLRRQPGRLRRGARRHRHDREGEPARATSRPSARPWPTASRPSTTRCSPACAARGLWLGAVLTEPKAPAVNTAARQAGFLVNAVQPDVVRIAPPLILTQAEASEFVGALPAILDAGPRTGGISSS